MTCSKNKEDSKKSKWHNNFFHNLGCFRPPPPNQNFEAMFFFKVLDHLIHIPSAVGTINEKRVPISSLKGMTSSSVVKKGPEKEFSPP